jgi:hypothetical protein
MNFDFKFLSESDVVNENVKQYISSHIRIIDSNYIEPFNDKNISNDILLKFIIKNKLEITQHFKSSVNMS